MVDTTVAPQSLAKNTSLFTIALVGQKVVSFLYFTFLARLLGPAQMGKYVLALSFAGVFSVLLDAGFSQLLTREVAREREHSVVYLNGVLGFKLALSLLVILLTVLMSHLVGYPPLTRQLIYIASLVMVLDSFTLTAYSVMRGWHVLTWESLGTVASQIVVGLVGVVISLFSQDTRWLMVALVLSSILNLTYAFNRLTKGFAVKLRPIFKIDLWRQLWWLVWPFTLAVVLTRLYGSADSVLLSILSGERAVGIYSVPYKITFAWQFIPSAFAASLFPGFSSYFALARDKLADTFSRGVIYLTAIGWPLSLGIALLARPIIIKIYPQYQEAVIPLQILILSLTFLFITFPIGSLLPACDRQKRHTLNIALSTIFNIALNIYLIPRYGATGAAVASLLATIFLLILGWQVVEQILDYDRSFLWGRLARVALCGLALAVVVLLLRNSLPLSMVIISGAVTYAGLLVACGGITRQELNGLWWLIKAWRFKKV